MKVYERIINITTIFIVEDNQDIVDTLILLLEVYGHNIVGTASNGEAAIERYKALDVKPQIILMDHRLPNKSGIETTTEILKINNSVKIIFISADKEIKKRALEVGAFCVINKPFIFDELIANINEALISN